jgi:3-oxoacyl-[acyl-carrier protein] reductase
MKEILVTGGSRGLGLAIVRRLLEQKNRVVAVQRSSSPELAALASSSSGHLRVVEFDLGRDLDSLEDHFRSDWFPNDQPLDGLVNNAALAYDDLITNLNQAPLTDMWNLNVQAPMVLTKAVIRRLILHNRPGSLVHISSVAAHTGYKGLAMYGASKGALEAFSRGVAREWGSRQIRSNCVVPGYMETSMSQKLPTEQRQKIYSRNALQAPTDIDSVASTVGFLLSDESCSITGQSIFVDNGSR